VENAALTDAAPRDKLISPASFSQSTNRKEALPQMRKTWRQLLHDEQGQDIAEYAVMLAVILVLVVGTIRLVGSQSNNVFSSVASSVQ
jgi:Flp pilus assembly pilin Flp